MIGLNLSLSLGNGGPSFGRTSAVYSAVRFPPENGEDPVDITTSTAGENGALYLPNTNNLFKSSAALADTATDLPWLNTAGALVGVATINRWAYDGMNRNPHLVGTAIAGSSSRYFALRYIPPVSTAAGSATPGALQFWAKAESATNAATVASNAIPDAWFSNGIATVLYAFRFDGTNMVFDLFRCGAGTKEAGTSGAKPASWAGIKRCTNPLTLGAATDVNWPKLAGTGAQNIHAFRGGMEFVAMLDINPTDTQLQNVAQGADPLTTFGASNCVLYCGLTSNGALSTAITSKRTSVTDVLGQRGTVYPGSTMRPQSQAAYFRVDSGGDPCNCTVLKGSTSALAQRTYSFAGASGAIQLRVADEDGVLIRDWYQIDTVPGSGSTGTLNFTLPLHPLGTGRAYRLAFRAGNGSGGWITHYENTDTYVGFAIAGIGQSEIVRAFHYQVDEVGNAGRSLSETYTGTNGRNVFLHTLQGTNPVIRRGRYNYYYHGAGTIRLVNALRSYTRQPLFIVAESVSGTSALDWIDDGQATRKWTDFALRLSTLGNRDAAGGLPMLTMGVMMWEQFYGQTNWAQDVARPVFTGVQSGTVGNGIAQADIDHWLYDGLTVNANFPIVVHPANRSITAATTEDGVSVADKRKNMRESTAAESAKVIIGHECAIHACETSGTDAGTHPDMTRETGAGPWCRSIAKGIALGMGWATYTQRTFTQAALSGSSATITLTLSGGTLDTEGNYNATAYGGSAVSPIGLDVSGHFEVQDGGSGAYTFSGFTAAITGTNTIVLTKTSGTWAAGTRVRFHSGSPGGYTGYSGAGNATTEDAWVKRSPVADNGNEIIGGNDALVLA